MSDEERREEEQAERARPRIVDKRVSARRAQGAQPSPGGTAPTQGPSSSPGPDVTAPDPVPAAAGQPPSTPAPQPQAPAEPAPVAPPPGDGEAERIWTPEEEAEAQRIAQEISARPSIEWVLNVAVTLANVAGTKLDLGDATDARLAIDALAGIVNGTGTSLGDAENPLRQTLAQLQLAYAQAMAPPTP
ncbi:MAG: hypothetical protein H0W55_14485 [Actinobacteria bacterium]|nr:hypothetical protein [Actinomycetota bacterium]MDQ3531698.1 hypothetical protein [Actinomycetota bacterium]